MADLIELTRRQQALASFGDFVLDHEDLDDILHESCRLIALALNVDLAKVIEIERESETGLVRAGIGWRQGIVGHERISLTALSSEAYAIEKTEPVITNDIALERRFKFPAFLREHGVVALVNVPILLPGRKPWGLLQVDAREPRKFDQDHIQYLKTYSMALGPVIDRLQVAADRENARITLADREERLRTVLEGIGDRFYVLDRQWRFIFASRSALMAWGKREDELLGRRFLDCFPDAGHGQAYAAHRRVMESGKAESFEAVSAVLNRWIEVDITPTKDAGLAVAFRDIEDRKQAEAALRASEELLDLASQAAEIGAWDYDLVAGICHFDARARGLYNLPPETVDHRLEDVAALVHPDDVGPMFDAIQRASEVHGDHRFDIDFRIAQADGSYRWLRAWGIAKFSGDGDASKAVRIVGASRDVTAEKGAEAALREREADLTRVQRIGQVGGVNVDVAGGLTSRRSPEYLRLHGLPENTQQESHADWLARLHPEDRERAETTMFAALAGGATTYESEYRIVRPSDGQIRWIKARLDIERGPDGAPLRLVGAHLDITEQKRLQEAEREMQEQQAFLLELSDLLRGQLHADAIAQSAVNVVAAHMRLDRCFIATLPSSTNEGSVGPEFFRSGLSPLADDHSEALQMMRRMHDSVVAIGDTAEEASFTAAERDTFGAMDIGALLCASIRLGETDMIWSFSAATVAPRDWTEGERRLSQEVAERTWAAVERARAEAALRESEERLRQFGEASQDVLWIRDVKTLQWTYLTPAFETIYGLDRAAALSGDNYRSWLDLIVPEDRDHANRSIQQVLQGEHVTFEYRVQRPVDGEVRWLRNTDFPITDAAGEVILIGGTGHDFTDVREAEEQLKTLMEGIPQLVWRAVDGGQWTWASPQWAAYTGQVGSDSHGLGWLEPLHPDDRPSAMDAWRHAIETGGFEVQYRIRSWATQEYRWFKTRATALRDGSGAIVQWLGTSTDVHDLRELQERQKVLVAELQHRTFNLMGMIRSTADATIRSSTTLDEFKPKFGDRISALARVQRLLSRLGDDDRITFGELIRGELDAVGALQSDDRHVTLDGPDNIALRSGTVHIFAMAIHELTTNAVKYGALRQEGAHLTVRWWLTVNEAGQPWLHVDWRETGVAMASPNAALGGTGQGRALIEGALPYQLGANTTYVMTPQGVHCTITMPISAKANVEADFATS